MKNSVSMLYEYIWTLIYVHFHLLFQMVKVKKTLTEVLLEVTNNEIMDIAREVYNKAKSKAAKGTTYIGQYCNRNLLIKFISLKLVGYYL